MLLLIAWWGIGNLYEAVVVLPLLWRLPGSPVLYFLPAGVALFVAVWLLVARVVRAGCRAAPVVTTAGLVTAAMVVTVPLRRPR